MKRLADARHAQAKADLEDKERRMEAARRELQVASKHLWYHQNMQNWGRDMWIERGLDEGLQDWFTLGACDSFSVNANYQTPTLTIPIIGDDMQLLNIKHRLIHPQKPNDKYRPETSGLGAFPPLLAVPSMGYDGDLVIVVEGEIKAMVTWSRIDTMDIQVIGVGGKDSFMRLSDKLAGKKVIVIPDPNYEKEAAALAKKLSGKILEVPMKIDDYLLETGIKGNNFHSLLRQARKA